MSSGQLISNRQLRERFQELEAQGYSAGDIARWLGWRRPATRGGSTWDGERLRRRLGLIPVTSRGVKSKARQIHESTAVEIARAMHLDPVDIGL